jgi:hypothetical protein
MQVGNTLILLAVLAAWITGFMLVHHWLREWSRAFTRKQRMRIGCLGSCATVVFLVLIALVGQALPEAIHVPLFILIIMPVGIGWLFFGNVWLFEIVKWIGERFSRHH